MHSDEKTTPNGHSSHGDKVIMVVDDSIVSRSVLRTSLKQEGFQVISARDGCEAMHILEAESHVDLIVTDFHMPHMDGPTLIANIRTKPAFKGIPVLVLTAGADDQEKCRAKAAGASGWIIKPFDASKLNAAIDRLVQ